MAGESAQTIVAIASAPGRGAVGVIRVSGLEVPRIAAAVLGALPNARTAHLAGFKDHDDRIIDRGLAVYFPAPASFTGEHVLELQGHGGPMVMDLLVQRLLALGCRLARPGEFSERAFLNGKMDVAQAEAVADLIDSDTAAAARAAVRSMQGEFSARIHRLQALLTDLRIHVEASIDFSEEDIEFLSGGTVDARLSAIDDEFASIGAAARQGSLLRDGFTVVIAGKPNAGKSSLLNRLVGKEVAIVTDLAGTTRDVLQHRVQLGGLPVNLVDTAGLRPTADVVETEGIRRAMAEIARADCVLYMADAREADAPAAVVLPGLSAQVPITVVLNKIDLSGGVSRLEETSSGTRIHVSVLTGQGVELIIGHLKTVAAYSEGQEGVFSARRRHLDALNRARSLVSEAAATLGATRAIELFAEDLRLAQQNLGEITGEMSSDDLLGRIFAGFCIGK